MQGGLFQYGTDSGRKMAEVAGGGFQIGTRLLHAGLGLLGKTLFSKRRVVGPFTSEPTTKSLWEMSVKVC